MRSIQIVALCVVLAVAYGVIHDQITARICIEYFTIGHPRVFPTESPTLLGLGWGVIATWWVGLLLGVPLSLAARAGGRPKRGVRSLMKPLGKLLIFMGLCAFFAGWLGFLLGRAKIVALVEPIAGLVPQARHPRYLADLWAHLASYAVGFVGGLVVIAGVWRSRSIPR